MEFVAQKADFAAAAQNTLRAVAGKPGRDDLGGIYIEALNDTVTLSGTDTELGIKCHFSAEIKEGGQALLPGRYLADIVRRLPPGPLLFKLNSSNGHVYINSGASHFELLALPTDNFPMFGFDDKPILASLPEMALRTNINQVSFAAAKDGLRQLLNSVLISFDGKKMRLVATDGHRLAVAEMMDLPEEMAGEYLIPVRSIDEVARLVAGQEEVQITGTDKQISFQSKSIMVQTRLVEGKYLPYESIIPVEFSLEAIVHRADLLAALDRAELFSADKINAVNLKLSSDGIGVFAESADIGKVEELVPADVQGDDLDISFNVRYLIEPLRILASEEVKLRFTGPQSAALITPTTSDLYKYLVMPITTRASV